MRGTTMLRLAAVAATLGTCPALAEKKPEPLPPFSQAYAPTNADERGAWMEADEFERKLRDSRSVIRDPALNAYVRGVLCRTVGADRCGAVRIYIQRVPAFNATMMANGAMTVWSGLLLRVRNEAELGAVLGHEFGHFELRHTLNGFRNRRGATNLIAWASILAPTAGLALQLDAIGGVFAFDRAQEREADLIGFRYLADCPYPSAAAADVWDRLMGETDATALGRRRKAHQHYTAGFFATHPTNLERATYLRSAAVQAADTDAPAVDGHAAAMAAWLPEFLTDQIKLNDFGGTEYLLAGLAATPAGWTAPLSFARGELYRERGNPRDLVSAAQFYREVIATGHAMPEAHRGLGLALLRGQEEAGGRAALATYLRLKPEASDAALISTLLSQ